MSVVPRSADSHPVDRRPHRPTADQRGFSLLELVVVIILVIILFLVAFDRLLPLRGDAEAAHVARIVGALRSAVGMEAASRVTRDGLPALAELEGINPMGLLQEWPDRYIGEVEGGDDREIPPGAWYFDRESDALAYRVRYPEYLEGEASAPVELRWRVELQITGEGEDRRPSGLRLAPLDAHRWPNQPRGRIQSSSN